MFKTLVLWTAVLGVSPSFAEAKALKPLQAHEIDLGTARGSAYYVPEPNGYRVIATLDTGSAAPIRFDTILGPGQSATVSIPAGLGQAPIQVSFVHAADRLDVVTSGLPSDVVTASMR